MMIFYEDFFSHLIGSITSSSPHLYYLKYRHYHFIDSFDYFLISTHLRNYFLGFFFHLVGSTSRSGKQLIKSLNALLLPKKMEFFPCPIAVGHSVLYTT